MVGKVVKLMSRPFSVISLLRSAHTARPKANHSEERLGEPDRHWPVEKHQELTFQNSAAFICVADEPLLLHRLWVSGSRDRGMVWGGFDQTT